jgi:polysaccharide deacetylase 2 family uncharacterized protein YibQ
MKKKKSDPRIRIALVITIVLALLVGIAVVIQETGKGPAAPGPAPGPPPGKHLPPRIVKEYALPELLIKGCLFDLGISRQDITFAGRTVKVAVRELPPEQRILKAFKALKAGGEVTLDDPSRLRVRIGGGVWDIIFSATPGELPKCAIIIDDMGQSLQTAELLGRIDADLTFAVLPDSLESIQVAEHLHARGREILLHLPMQGNGKDPGPGAILQGMSPDEVRSVLKDDLKRVPYISGVNNHMGSLITTNPNDMRLVFRELKRESLFFVDSKTTSKSVCSALARDFRVPFAARDVFLDNERNAPYITGQIEKLVRLSLKNSSAVGICHPHPETIAVLQKEVPRLKKLGVEVVRVSALMDRPENAR